VKKTSHHACGVALPGDTLIIGVNKAISAEELQRMAEGIEPALPDGVKVVVVDNVSAIQVVRGGEQQ
jgi:hypothetical protein